MAGTPYPRSDRDPGEPDYALGRRQAGYKQLVRELGLGGGRERRLLVEQLTKLVARGELVRGRRGTCGRFRGRHRNDARGGRNGRPDGAAASGPIRSGRDRLISGKLDLHRDGFGFVRRTAAARRRPTTSSFRPTRSTGRCRAIWCWSTRPAWARRPPVRAHRAGADAAESDRGGHLPLRARAGDARDSPDGWATM